MTYFIGEVGSNYFDLKDCLESVRECKRVGADAVKFQHFSRNDLHFDEVTHDPDISLNWVKSIAEECKRVNIDFILSVFNPERVEHVNEYVNAFKVASSDCDNFPLIDAMVATGKPVYVSWPSWIIGKYLDDNAFSKFIDEKYDDKDVRYLYCSPEYPARYIEPHYMNLLPRRKHAGYSDHSTDVFGIAFLAVGLFGAKFLEKHVRLPHIQGTPDYKHSITIEEFGQLIAKCRGEKVDATGEQKFYCSSRRVMVATQDLYAGMKLTTGNSGLYRANSTENSVTALDWYTDEKLYFINRNIKKGETISKNDIV